MAFQRPRMIPQPTVHQPDVVEADGLSRAVADLALDGQRFAEQPQRLCVVAQRSADQSDVAAGDRSVGAVAHLLLDQQGTGIVLQRPAVITATFMDGADVVEHRGLEPVVHVPFCDPRRLGEALKRTRSLAVQVVHRADVGQRGGLAVPISVPHPDTQRLIKVLQRPMIVALGVAGEPNAVKVFGPTLIIAELLKQFQRPLRRAEHVVVPAERVVHFALQVDALGLGPGVGEPPCPPDSLGDALQGWLGPPGQVQHIGPVQPDHDHHSVADGGEPPLGLFRQAADVIAVPVQHRRGPVSVCAGRCPPGWPRPPAAPAGRRPR